MFGDIAKFTFIWVVCSSIWVLATPINAMASSSHIQEPILICLGDETAVASAVVTEAPYDADNTGKVDVTAAIQKAIDDVGKLNGGVVYLPAGRYRLDGGLILGYGTTLMGQWEHPEYGDTSKCTVLLAYGGRGNASQPALIQSRSDFEGALVNIAIYYPEQRPDDIQPYPPTVKSGQINLKNVTLYNSYDGIALTRTNACVLENVCGTVLNRGIVSPLSSEFAWMHDIHFSNDYWQMAEVCLEDGEMSLEQRAAIDEFTSSNLIGFELGKIDALAIYRFSADDAKSAVVMKAEQTSLETDLSNDLYASNFGGVVAGFPSVCEREEHGWAPWWLYNLYQMHYANVDNVPEAAGRSYEFAKTPMPARTDSDSLINVKNAPYFASGTGQADDTAVIKEALADAKKQGGGTVYLPPGAYRVTEPLVVPEGVELRGPLGTVKARSYRMTCVILAFLDDTSQDPETAPALITLTSNSGVRGFEVYYPQQSRDMFNLKPYPYTIRGLGENTWIVDMNLLNSYYGIDLASHKNDRYLVRGVWATAFMKGIDIGGGSRDGKLERLAFTWGMVPYAMEIREDLQKFVIENSIYYSFGHSEGLTAWGLVGFDPNTHFYFYEDEEGHTVDAEFWLSMLDAGYRSCIHADSGENIDLLGVFAAGWIRATNWLEVGEGFQGPLNIYGKTVARHGHNRPYDFTPRQVRFCDESSLTADKEAIESLGNESMFDKIRKLFSRQNDADKDPFRDAGPHSATDRDPWTFWEAPAGSCLIVDLGEVRTINRFRLESAGLFKGLKYNAVEAELYVSIDGDNFAKAGKMNLDRSNFNATYAFSWGDVAIEPIQARYVRLNVTRPGTDGKIRIASFDVFGY